MPELKHKILKHITAVILVAVIGICAGRVGRVLYNFNFRDVEIFESDDIRGAAEIETAGRHYSILPFILERGKADRAASLLKDSGIDCKFHEDKLMVENGKIPLAMDVLQAAGLSPDARHFSFREITADPAKEPQRYALQNRLATQNMLANMIALMSAEITAAEVVINPETKTVSVRLSRKTPGTPLPPKLQAEIAAHVKAAAGEVTVQIDGGR